MRRMPVAITLPVALTREIGRVVTGHAILEHLLSEMTYSLLRIPPEEGRLAVIEGSATQRFDVARRLWKLKGIKPSVDTTAIRNLLGNVETERDRFAHCVWVRDPRSGEYLLRVTRGELSTDKTTPRKVKPEGIPYSVEKCRETRAQIEALIEVLDTLRGEIEDALATLHETPYPQAPPSSPHQAWHPKAAPAQPEP